MDKMQQQDIEYWFEENHRDVVAMRFPVRRTLFSGQSDYQKIEIVETAGHGRMLINDGCVMISERDEFIYHEMIAHVPLFSHPVPQKVLIIGGGDGGTAREVLRHPGVKSCHMVEIDEMVVNACRELIPSTAKALDNERLRLDIADGVQFMADTDEKYDVILVDSTDPVGPAAPLFGEGFYGNVYERLNDNGIVVAQGESPFYDVDMQKTMMQVMGKFFPFTTFYNFTNSTYPGGLWSFALASKGLHPVRDFDPQRVEKAGLSCSYYSREVHTQSFVWPQFMKKNLRELCRNE